MMSDLELIKQLEKEIGNNLRIFLKKLGDEKPDYSKILKGAKKGVETPQKVGRTYNKVAQWLALPQVPGVLLK